MKKQTRLDDVGGKNTFYYVSGGKLSNKQEQARREQLEDVTALEYAILSLYENGYTSYTPVKIVKKLRQQIPFLRGRDNTRRRFYHKVYRCCRKLSRLGFLESYGKRPVFYKLNPSMCELRTTHNGIPHAAVVSTGNGGSG